MHWNYDLGYSSYLNDTVTATQAYSGEVNRETQKKPWAIQNQKTILSNEGACHEI